MPTKVTAKGTHEQRIAGAMKDLEKNKVISHVANSWNLDPHTLSDRVSGRTTAHLHAHESQQKLSDPQEKALVAWIESRSKMGLPPKPTEVATEARLILYAAGDAYPTLHDHWVTDFVRRHKGNLKTYKLKSLDRSRAMVMTKSVISANLDLLEEIINEYNILPEHMWNMDETGFMIGGGSKANERVIGTAYGRHPPKRQQDGNREWITLIECISAAAGVLPPFFISPGQVHTIGTYSRVEEIDLEACYEQSPKGWSSDMLALKWLDHFIQYTKPSTDVNVWRLLICDNHNSHMTFEFRHRCHDNQVAIFFFSAHITHILQPLDVGIFSPLDRYYRQFVDAFLRNNPIHTPIHRGDTFVHINEGRRKALSDSNMKSAWSATGIFPLNRSRILSHPDIVDDTQQSKNHPPTRNHLTELAQFNKQVINSLGSEVTPQGKENVEKLTQIAEELETSNTILKDQLDLLLNRPKTATGDRRRLPKPRGNKGADILLARKAREEAPKAKKRGRPPKTSIVQPTTKRRRKHRNSDTITVDDEDNMQLIMELENAEIQALQVEESRIQVAHPHIITHEPLLTTTIGHGLLGDI